MAEQDVGRATPTSGSGNQSMYQRVDQALTNTFGPINRGIESVTGKPDPMRNLFLALSAMRAGPRMLPANARYIGVPKREYTNPVVNGDIDYFTVNARDRYSSPGVTGMARQMPDYPMPGGPTPQSPMPGGSGGPSPGGNPVGPPSNDLILRALQSRANAGAGQGFLNQTRMDQSRGMPINMQSPANAGAPAQAEYSQMLLKQLLGGQ